MTFCVSIHAKEVSLDKELNLSVLQTLCQNQTEEDIYLNTYINEFPFENYAAYQVENRDFYFVEKITPDAIKTHVIKNGALWERHVYEQLKKYAKIGTIAIDIGAHIGTHTIALSRFVGPSGYVVAFEPQLKLFSELAINTYLNECQNVSFFRRALGELTQWSEMQPTNTMNEGATLIGKGGDKVKMEMLDSYNLNNISVIKIDVEGYEMQVLTGGIDTILRNKPVMIIEIWNGPNREAKIQTIENLGYTSTWLTGDDFLFVPSL